MNEFKESLGVELENVRDSKRARLAADRAEIDCTREEKKAVTELL